MKEFNGSRRIIRKAGSIAGKLISTVGSATRDALTSEPLETKTHNVSIGFNAPKTPGTKIRVSLYPFGAKHHAFSTKLEKLYGNESLDFENIKMHPSDNTEHVYF